MRRRSTKVERAMRINRAVKLLKRFRSNRRAIDVMRQEYGISRPQAYRYVQEAEKHGEALQVPEEKEAVIVKLPLSMSKHIRRLKKKGKGSISGIMTKSLRAYLKRNGT